MADDDRAFQPERTGLAWVRTLVAVAGTWGLVAIHFAQRGWLGAAGVTALLAAIVLIAAGHLGRARITRAQAAMAAGSAAPEPTAMLLMTAFAIVAALAAIVAAHG